MNKLRIYPYKLASASAKVIRAKVESSLMVHPTRNTFRPLSNHRVLNWGNTETAPWMSRLPVDHLLNKPEAVTIASDKIKTFRTLSEIQIPIPMFTIDRTSATRMFDSQRQQVSKVVVRKLTRASSGRGIEIVERGDTMPEAPLYTGYIEPRSEYRVHIFEGRVIDVTKKRRRTVRVEDGTLNPLIRNHESGWVFAHNNVNLDNEGLDIAVGAVEALGLDFGAVDLVHAKQPDSRGNNFFVLEINTAPGLDENGTTSDAWINAITAWVSGGGSAR